MQHKANANTTDGHCIHTPTPVVFQEPIPRSMENNIIKDLYGKTLHTFSSSTALKMHLRGIFIVTAILCHPFRIADFHGDLYQGNEICRMIRSIPTNIIPTTVLRSSTSVR